jgi:hypothetical protein
MADELINKIYDVSAIQKEADQIAAIVKSTTDLISQVRGMKDFAGLSDASKKLNDNMVAGKKAVEEYTAVEKELIAQKKQLETVEAKRYAASSKNSQEIILNKKLLAEQNELLKAQAVLNDKNSGTLEKLTAQNKILGIEKKKLNLETSEGAARLKEIIALEDKNNEALKVGQNADQKRTASIGEYKKQIGELVGQFKAGEIGTGKLAGGFAKLGKQMIVSFVTNPIFLALAAVVLLIKGVKDAIGESEERTNKMSEAFARFKPILRTIGDAFEVVADIVIKYVDFMGRAYSAVTEFLGINPKGSADQFVQAEKSKQQAILETRKLNEDASNQEAIIAEQREIIANKEDYTYKQRVEALKLAGEAEKQLSLDRQRIAELNLKALEEEAALDDNDAAMNDKLSAAIVAVNTARIESANVGRKLAKEQQKLTKENEADLKAESDARKAAAKEREEAAKETARKLIEANRMLIDSQLNLMTEGEEKQIAISNEAFKRQLEDLKANGQLTAELQQNLEKAHGNDIQKIKDDFAKQAEEKRKTDLDTAIADFEKNTQKEIEELSASYRIKETELKKEYAKGKKSKEWYEDELLKIQEAAAIEANTKTIERLQKELEISNLSTDKKLELSNQLRDLQLENENLVTDSVIKANEKQVESEKEKFRKILAVTEQIASAGMDLYSAIGDLQKQQSEERLAELDEQQKKNDEFFSARQKNLDNALMSDGMRADAQKKIDEEKAKRDKEIADKVRAEKVKAAKFEKAQSIVSAGINTALAVIKALVDPGGVLGAVFAILAGTTGAIQIAKIASTKIPEYATGTMSTKNEIALWGEVRPEVAVTRTGDIMFAEKPEIRHFDAGTRIFKSVEEFEKNISMTKGVNDFKIDYNKMGDSIASRMPGLNVNLDSRGLWSEVNKEGNRRTVINRRFKIGN